MVQETNFPAYRSNYQTWARAANSATDSGLTGAIRQLYRLIGRHAISPTYIGVPRLLAHEGSLRGSGWSTADGANAHDIRLLHETIEHCLDRWPHRYHEFDEHLCQGNGYDSAAIRELVESVFKYTSHIRSRGEEQREASRKRGSARRGGSLNAPTSGSIAFTLRSAERGYSDRLLADSISRANQSESQRQAGVNVLETRG
jgi:hypothetical protein